MRQTCWRFLRAHAIPLAVGLGLGVLGYVVILPWFWPCPRVVVAVPAAVQIGTDLPVEIIIQSWHSNYQVNEVRFYVDYTEAVTAVVPGATVYPIVLDRATPRREWGYWDVRRITWPHTRRRAYVVPLQQLTEAGALQRGVLRGQVDVTMTHPWVRGRYSGNAVMGFRACEDRYTMPFTLNVE